MLWQLSVSDGDTKTCWLCTDGRLVFLKLTAKTVNHFINITNKVINTDLMIYGIDDFFECTCYIDIAPILLIWLQQSLGLTKILLHQKESLYHVNMWLNRYV
ncbi:hypothetical protein BCU91_08005 [Shewanella sp. 10N.286.52.B9]|nr:hypothetical protein BCU91_08005 [Shewanella sp. 10N.286.52.B9]